MSTVQPAIPRSFFHFFKHKQMSTGSEISYDSASNTSTPRSESPFVRVEARPLAKTKIGKYNVAPALLQKYELKEKLGQGGFGVVYRAVMTQRPHGFEETDNGNVAIKVILRSAAGRVIKDPELGMIPVEAFILRRIKHKNIIKLIDFYQDANAFYIVTELAGSNWEQGRSHSVASRDLFEMVDSANGLPEDQCRKIFRQLVSAIAYLQLSCSLVHRDIKDENICIDADLNIKLIDFGSVARFSQVNAEQKDYFKQFHGTLSFVAPEHIRKETYRGPEAEMWSLGCVLFTCLRNRAPFANEDEVMHRDPTAGLEKYASAQFIDVIARLLQKDSSKRITIEELLRHPWLRV